ncbi:unnamed protein product [Chironomus riparius]|uniref:Importin subunit alpha n=1 Tax=Chironomus riparius TaxID=315576 RepID=A0A9N9WJ96_9DIPT|nr:unnamed protein product [Chironomus riparius]
MTENSSNFVSAPSSVEWLYSNDPKKQLICLKSIRKKLSKKDPDIENMLYVTSRVLELIISRNDSEGLRECTWILTNIASGYSLGVDEILKLNGTTILKKLIDKTSDNIVKNQCFWTFSNIACEDEQCRDHVLSLGIFHSLITFIKEIFEENDEDILKTCIWTLANFFLPKFTSLHDDYCKLGLKMFIKCFRHSNQILRKEAAFGILHIMENRKYIDNIIESGILNDIRTELEFEEDTKMLSCMIRIVGNLAWGNDQQTQSLIDNDFIYVFHKLLYTEHKELLKEVIWTLSNIAAGNRAQVKAIMDGQIFPKLIGMLNDENFRIRREAVWVINNSTQNGSSEVIVHLVKLEVLKYLTTLLDDDDHEIVKACVDSIFNILQTGEMYFKDVNLFAILVDKYGSLKKIEHLQFHKSWLIVDKVLRILESFYKRDVKEVPKI